MEISILKHFGLAKLNPFNSFIAVHLAPSNATAVNVFPNMNSVIHVSDAKMAVMSQHIYATQNEFRAFSKRYIHRHDQEVTSTVHSSVEMGDAVQRPSYALAEMDAGITAMKIAVVYAVSCYSEFAILEKYHFCNRKRT